MKTDNLKYHFWLSPCLPLILSCVFLAQAAEKVPAPEEFFGFRVGADFHLVDYGQAVAYWKELEKSTKRVKLFEYGQSSEGRTMVFAAVSSEGNMARLEEIKALSKRLSLVRGVAEDEAKRLAAEGKAIVWIDGGLHASEVAPAQHILQLSYDLATDESPKFQRIRDEVVAMLVLPNPDGMDMVARWYRKNLGTAYETSPLPWIYQKYIGHDNNRDSFMLSVPETRNINQVVHHEWYPHIFYNHHQESPYPTLIFVPPDAEPTNPNLHPLLLRWQNVIGTVMALAFEAEGKQGVISRFLFDTWYPGYVTQVCDFHNIISTFSETFLFNYASPRFFPASEFPKEYGDFTSSMFFTNPWRGGWWHFRDAVEYCLTASKSVLDLAARLREELLYAKYSMGRETIEKYSQEPPFGWIVPLEQRDPGVALELIGNLITLDIEVYRSESSFRADGIDYPQGTYILPTSQPFGRFLKTLFEVQEYPDLRSHPSLWQSIVEPIKLKIPPLQTYDVLGWTLPLQWGVKSVMMHTPLQAKTRRVYEADWPKGKVGGRGGYAYAIPCQPNNSARAINLLWKAGVEVFRAQAPFKSEATDFPPGTFIVPTSKAATDIIKKAAPDLYLNVQRIDLPSSARMTKLREPRTAIYQSWEPANDEGWTELVLKNHGFSFSLLHDAEMKAGELRDHCEVIILPSQSPDAIVAGHPKGTMPPEYAGGLTQTGVRNLGLFVKEGGTLVTLGSACDFAIEQLNLPVKNILKGLSPEEFFGSGLLLNTVLDQDNALTFGMPKESAVFFAASPTFSIWAASEEKDKPSVIARYSQENLALSGWMVGEKYLLGKAAAVEVPLGRGKVILLGFGVQHRGQTKATFKLLFNSIFSAAAKD